jgi:maltose alpha-D-glucosyltransferase/alpha-amylase
VSGSDALVDLASAEPPDLAHETIGAYLETARLLGERTADLHLALASDREDAAFAPEPFTALAQRSLYQSIRTRVVRTFREIRASSSSGIPGPDAVERALVLEHAILVRLRRLLDVRIAASRIRVHGDYHLGQVLHTGRDFVIIDFEGEPAVPLGERRIKRSSMRDVAGMIRSFDYAARTAAAAATTAGVGQEVVEPWASFWYRWVSATFLRSYLATAGEASFVPSDREQLDVLLDVHLLAKAVYELAYEANNRPEMIAIPAEGILRLFPH